MQPCDPAFLARLRRLETTFVDILADGERLNRLHPRPIELGGVRAMLHRLRQVIPICARGDYPPPELMRACQDAIAACLETTDALES